MFFLSFRQIDEISGENYERPDIYSFDMQRDLRSIVTKFDGNIYTYSTHLGSVYWKTYPVF